MNAGEGGCGALTFRVSFTLLVLLALPVEVEENVEEGDEERVDGGDDLRGEDSSLWLRMTEYRISNDVRVRHTLAYLCAYAGSLELPGGP